MLYFTHLLIIACNGVDSTKVGGEVLCHGNDINLVKFIV